MEHLDDGDLDTGFNFQVNKSRDWVEMVELKTLQSQLNLPRFVDNSTIYFTFKKTISMLCFLASFS